jgi:hypothetical protein
VEAISCTEKQKSVTYQFWFPDHMLRCFSLTQSCFFSLEIDPDMIDVLKNKFLLKMVRSVGEGVMRMMPSSLLELLTEITKLRGQPP